MSQNQLVIATEDSTTPTPESSHTAHGGMVILTWVAIAFGIASLPGALVLLQLPEDLPIYDLVVRAAGLAPATATISWILALVAAAVSGIRLVRPPRTRNSKKAFAMAAPGAVLGAVALGFAIYYVGSMLGLTQANEAERAGERAVEHYLDQGATLVCDNGDNGHGPNRYPWYVAYLEVPATLGTEAQAREATKEAGYEGARRTDVSDQYDLPSDSGAFQVESLAERKPAFDGDQVSPNATVKVFPWGQVSRWCSAPDESWGEGADQKEGTLLIAIYIELDSTR